MAPLSKIIKRPDLWATSVKLISTMDGLADFRTHFARFDGQFDHVHKDMLEDFVIEHVGEFENGKLFAAIWGESFWTPNSYAEQSNLEKLVLDWTGCLHLEVRFLDGGIRVVGLLEDFPDFYLGKESQPQGFEIPQGFKPLFPFAPVKPSVENHI